jgi:hypothetical protein
VVKEMEKEFYRQQKAGRQHALREEAGRKPFVGSMLLCGRAAGKKSARR